MLPSACRSTNRNVDSISNSTNNYPPLILWAWERPEDLRFIDSDKIGVAFLAQTLILHNDDVEISPRRQPMKVLPETFLIAVTRIETNKKYSNSTPSLSDAQKNKIIESILQTLKFPNVRAIQVDFDATVSERTFYTNLLKNLRLQLPENVSLSMTALASWCIADRWIKDLPVNEAVPMLFDMGADERTVNDFLASDSDWNEPLCQNSYGISINQHLNIKFKEKRRIYIFNKRAWREEDLKVLPQGVLQR